MTTRDILTHATIMAGHTLTPYLAGSVLYLVAGLRHGDGLIPADSRECSSVFNLTPGRGRIRRFGLRRTLARLFWIGLADRLTVLPGTARGRTDPAIRPTWRRHSPRDPS